MKHPDSEAEEDTVPLVVMKQPASVTEAVTVLLATVKQPTPIAEQDTVSLAALHGSPPASPHTHKTVGKLTMAIQSMITGGLARLKDPDPEGFYTSRQQTTTSSAIAWGWLPIVTLTSAFGLFITAYAFISSRDNGTGLAIFFFLGLPLIVAPTVIRLIMPASSRFERIGLLCILSIYYYLVNVITNLLYFPKYDEFLHWHTAEDIYRTRHLFSKNVLLPVSPYYPGLEIVTNAFSTLSGLDTLHSGLIVIGVARLVMILSLFMLTERITKSSRIASIATMIYMANPQFLLFDSLFAYESFALPLAAFVMFAMGPHRLTSIRPKHPEPVAQSMLFSVRHSKDMTNSFQWISLTSWLALGAMVLTHHLTSFFFDGLLLSWAVIDVVMFRIPLLRSKQAITAILAFLLTVAAIMYPGNPVVEYAFSFGGDMLNQLGHLLSGAGAPRQILTASAGHPTPILWVRILTISSMALIVLCIPFGLLCLWQRYRFDSLAVTFGVISLFYLISQALQFTASGAELEDRLVAFLFIPVALVLAIFIAQFWPTRYLDCKQMALVTCMLLIIFLGGVLLGAGSDLGELPGPYAVMSDARSIEPEGIQAAMWAHSYLESGSRVVTDHINQLLMDDYGDQDVMTLINDRVDISPIFFSLRLGSNELSLLRQTRAHYLVADLRVTRSLPSYGYYYDIWEDGAFHHTTPVDVKALTKFSTIPQVNKIFDGGDIVIYDVGGLLDAPQKH